MKRESRKRKKWVDYLLPIVTISGLILLLFRVGYLHINVYKSSKKTYYNTVFKGTIVEINQAKGITYILLYGDEKYWSIDHSYNYDYKNPFIANFLKEKDIIQKNKCSDTLFIYRKSKEYHYLIGDALYNSKSHSKEFIYSWNKKRSIIKEKGSCK